MKVSIPVPEAWIEIASEYNVPKHKMKLLFKYYITIILPILKEPYYWNDFGHWLESATSKMWFQEHKIKESNSTHTKLH